MYYTIQIPHGVDEKEAVRIFVQFTRLESAIKGILKKLLPHTSGWKA